MCLTIFYVIHLLAIFSDSAEWVITCSSSGEDDVDLYKRKIGMAYKLGEILKKLN
uniref:MEG 2.4 isoform 3 n=1 Tax=Schistosoma mansoni TaxID=6183 RepID=D7PD67_SCHMA|nr:MEG 2.4 isoform 3 [Schistosoma mansoni]